MIHYISRHATPHILLPFRHPDDATAIARDEQWHDEDGSDRVTASVYRVDDGRLVHDHDLVIVRTVEYRAVRQTVNRMPEMVVEPDLPENPAAAVLRAPVPAAELGAMCPRPERVPDHGDRGRA